MFIVYGLLSSFNYYHLPKKLAMYPAATSIHLKVQTLSGGFPIEKRQCDTYISINLDNTFARAYLHLVATVRYLRIVPDRAYYVTYFRFLPNTGSIHDKTTVLAFYFVVVGRYLKLSWKVSHALYAYPVVCWCCSDLKTVTATPVSTIAVIPGIHVCVVK